MKHGRVSNIIIFKIQRGRIAPYIAMVYGRAATRAMKHGRVSNIIIFKIQRGRIAPYIAMVYGRAATRAIRPLGVLRGGCYELF